MLPVEESILSHSLGTKGISVKCGCRKYLVSGEGLVVCGADTKVVCNLCFLLLRCSAAITVPLSSLGYIRLFLQSCPENIHNYQETSEEENVFNFWTNFNLTLRLPTNFPSLLVWFGGCLVSGGRMSPQYGPLPPNIEILSVQRARAG